MARRREPPDEPLNLPAPAKTQKGRENQLVNAAMDLVEQRMAQGTASAQETVHFLKLGSSLHLAQLEKIESENAVLQARVKDLESRTSSEGLYAQALAAFRGYAGQDVDEDDDYDEDVY